ncbi:hypothetical protein POTOM_012790 [Populus tomentosa]|uniref:Rx N-terminal domain-containing protein n=1 Tax=Populus tomentosa TaxID=118781 RepID=A0A8X8A7W7_POPTO|nr:hypothetical protein POTOM_012790 [Populus tomentosa]
MAEALVGGAFLSAFLNVLLERMASRQVGNFFRGQKVNNRLLKKLAIAMRSASRVLDDAEEKQITSTAVWDWLAELKDAVYEADDFLDAIAYKAPRQELKAEDQTSICHMQRFLSFFNLCKNGLGEIEDELKVLLQDLDRLVDRIVALGLIPSTGKDRSWPKTPEETSLVDERDVYGRDEDEEAILNASRSSSMMPHPSLQYDLFHQSKSSFVMHDLMPHPSLQYDLFHQSKSSFVMHDLMHDLATNVSGQFCFSSRLGENNSSKATRMTRHLSLVYTEDTDGVFSSTILENIREAPLLRTSHTFPRYLRCPPEIYNEIFQLTLGRLRVLFMSGCTDAAKMLCSTSKLKHLRYLDLSFSQFLVTLPEEVSALPNLQTLILENCRNLARLPDLGNLKHLRHLNLQGTGIERLPESLERLINLRYLNISDTPLKEMPPHIGQLTKLRTLTIFLVGRQSETSIKELGKLRHLRGELHIKNLQNVVDARDAAEANLKGKEDLDKLRFTWDGDTHDPQHVRSTLEKLEPTREVKDLHIYGYGGIRFPEWVGESSFSNIVSLKLSRCTNCTSLPPLGQLASLEDLSIERFDKVVTGGSEFYGNCTAKEKPFKSLKTLSFRWMPEWREWISDEGIREAFPLLEFLSIKDCPNLTKALPGHNLPRLTSLEIKGCEQLAAPLPMFPRLHSLDVSEFHSLESLPEEIDQMGCSPSDLGDIKLRYCASLKCVALDLVPKLNSLFIHNCPDLESLCANERPFNDLTSLRLLAIRGCPKLVLFPKGRLPAPVLTELSLQDCRNLKLLPESMPSLLPSLNRLEIRVCSEVELCPEGGFPSTLQSLQILYCNKLIAGRMQWGLQTLPSLSRFAIGWDKNVESFPEEMLLPSSLTYLKMDSLKHLKYLDYKGLQHLTCLRELHIYDCPLIESMPEEGLPSSLSSLYIHRCPMLGESCEREKGKDWPKISHIPQIVIWSGRRI